MNPELLSFPSSLVGAHPRPRRPFTDPFSSPVPSWGDVPEADSEAVPTEPLRRLRSCFFDDGPHSEIREGDLSNMRGKYMIHHSVGMRSPIEFERAPDGGAGEVAVYEAYLEAGFRGVISFLVGEVSSFFGFCPSQLTPMTWRTLMAIQVLGELHRFSVGVHEILYSYYFAPSANKEGFYHLRSRDGPPLVEEPSRGVRGNHPFGGGWNSRCVYVKIQEPVGYPTSWRTVHVSHPVSFAGEAVTKLIMGVPRRFRWVTFLMSREALPHSRVWAFPFYPVRLYLVLFLTILFPGNVARLPVSVVYDEYQKVKARKRRLSYTPPPKQARAALSANGLSFISSTSAEIFRNRDLLVDAHRRLTGEVFLLRSQVQDMMARRDLLVQQVKASARWELMKEWLERRVDH
ncbi:hypothetical protein F2Q70_00016940 [Brassica cretica]|uniref:Uncharacterized protein n=1 Tax=Brassica cretica TaxID=69181 RepID=A0A3N6QIV0_BRACR|nr:hypothetical protein F2Q70_00016940 [Brassica cretica]KAF2599447.1 hypothetical protein F2Q68_00009904 [Brassica cretica]